jgi:hypothetical protein
MVPNPKLSELRYCFALGHAHSSIGMLETYSLLRTQYPMDWCRRPRWTGPPRSITGGLPIYILPRDPDAVCS